MKHEEVILTEEETEVLRLYWQLHPEQRAIALAELLRLSNSGE